MKEYIIGKKTPEGLALSAISYTAEQAIIQQGVERDTAANRNPYDGYIPTPAARDRALYKSAMGTNVYADVTFDSVTYTDNKGNVITTPKMTFYSILVDVSFPRNVVKTEIQGRDGTVKEYIGEGDASLNFKGIITGGNGIYPYDEVNALKQIIKAPVSIPVISQYLQMLDIHTIVFEDRDFAQPEGSISYQQFSLNAVQDTPIEIQIL